MKSQTLATIAIAVVMVLSIGVNAPVDTGPDYLAIVKVYANTMIEQGRDTYGQEHTPLFAAGLDRKTFEPGKFPGIQGIRGGDRATTGANPMHDENLYQVLYALTEITGDEKYAREADRALEWFFNHCQSPATGLMTWGEHIGWDFYTDKMRGKDTKHEFFRPWILWDKCWKLTPDAAEQFAKGLWIHQISNHETGNFSRHATWSKHGPGVRDEYPRHGGFYIMTWAKAYRETQDPIYPKAVETLVDMYNRISSEQTGAIPCSTDAGRARIMWPESCLSLAIDLTNSAPVFPQSLRKKMLERAAKTDEVYQSLKHDFSPKGVGFVAGADIHTLQAFARGSWTHTEPWATGYGKATDAQVANLCYLRYRQLADGPVKNVYRKLILACAARYLDSKPNLEKTIYPGPIGDAIVHMVNAYTITGQRRYLDRADVFGRIAVSSFLDDDSPLPKASSQHDHYEAITRGDTMMMALLKLALVEGQSDVKVDLVYSDR